MATTARIAKNALLIYDGDCGVCSATIEWLRENLPVIPRPVPSYDVDLTQHGLTQKDVSEKIWLVTPGHHFGGYLAFAEILRRQPSWWLRFSGHLIDTPPISWAAGLVYAGVANNRYRFPGSTCQVPGQDTLIAPAAGDAAPQNRA